MTVSESENKAFILNLEKDSFLFELITKHFLGWMMWGYRMEL